MRSFESLRYESEGHIAKITLNRGESHNAIDDVMHAELLDVFHEIRQSDDIRCVLLASTGKSFSAGGDLDMIVRLQNDLAHREHMCDTGVRLINALIDTRVPVVAAMQGDAIGLGASVLLTCDVIVASRTARLGDPHVKVGLVAGDGGCLLWPAAIGMNRAKRYLLTGDLIAAEEAQQMGLISDLVETPDDALPGAQEIAEKIAALPPIAVRGTKQSLNALLKARAREVFDLSMAYEMHAAGSEDVLEAVAAFKERRAPVYKNR